MVPIVVGLPVDAVTPSAAIIAIPSSFRATSVGGSLQALTSGTFSIDVKTGGVVIATLTWTEPGVQHLDIDYEVLPYTELTFDVTSVGVGAANCYVAVWGVLA